MTIQVQIKGRTHGHKMEIRFRDTFTDGQVREHAAHEGVIEGDFEVHHVIHGSRELVIREVPFEEAEAQVHEHAAA